MKSRHSNSALTARRGSVLIVALIIMAVIALAVTSYLNLNLSSSRLASRGFKQTAAFNLAEAGAEEALWSLNRANARASDAWTGWNIEGAAARRAFTGFDFGGNSTGTVKVYLDNFSPTGRSHPTVVALAAVQAPGEAPVTKMLEMTLRRRSRFSAGLMARESITFAGQNTSVDSWNSDPDDDATTAPVEYSSETRNDRGSVASADVGNTAVLINQATVWGFVYTGGAAPQVGVQGSITGRDTPGGVTVDPARVATDFTADFPVLTAPIDGVPIATIGATLGTPGLATKWRCNGISLNGNETLTILGDVTLILTVGSGARALDVTGNGSILVPEGSSLTVYVEGDVLIAGKGLANNNVRPITCQILSTNNSPGGQSLHVAGNGALRGVVYAPNADVKINGNGDIMGSVVARKLTLTGNAAFHYDESLARASEDTPFGVQNWRELTTETARQVHAAKFLGW